MKKVVYSQNFKELRASIFSTKNPLDRAIMYCFPEDVFRQDKGCVKSLYISYLDALGNSGKGLGTNLLKFAKFYSKKIGCEGRLHLTAVSDYKNAERIPHIFYRKSGMNTGYKCIDKLMDWFIKEKVNATYLDFNSMEMFYPPIKYPLVKERSLFSKIKKIFS